MAQIKGKDTEVLGDNFVVLQFLDFLFSFSLVITLGTLIALFISDHRASASRALFIQH